MLALHLNQEELTKPSPTTPTQVPLAERLREILRTAPGVPELNEAWDWLKASVDKEGRVSIPGRDGFPDLKIVSMEEMRKIRPGVGALASGDHIEFGVSTSPGEVLGARAVENLESLGVKFLKPVTAEAEHIYEVSKLIHELAHLPKAGIKPGGEFMAFTAQYSYLAKQGVVEMPSRATILKHIQQYDPRVYGEEVMVAFNGEITSEALELMPGGKKFSSNILTLRGTNPNDVWNSDFGDKFLEGVETYFRQKALSNKPSQPTPEADLVEQAIIEGSKKAEELRKLLLTRR